VTAYRQLEAQNVESIQYLLYFRDARLWSHDLSFRPGLRSKTAFLATGTKNGGRDSEGNPCERGEGQEGISAKSPVDLAISVPRPRFPFMVRTNTHHALRKLSKLSAAGALGFTIHAEMPKLTGGTLLGAPGVVMVMYVEIALIDEGLL